MSGLLAALSLAACGSGGSRTSLVTGDAASKVYVAPGEYDEFYAFLSGGFSGQVTVYGLPSGRLLKQIPVFSQYPRERVRATPKRRRPMLETTYGFVPWDDTHHPELSQTDGVPDGRWLFINGNNTPRVARIDLTRFETDEILEIPNAAGGHASPFITPNTKYIVSRHALQRADPERRRADRELQGELQRHCSRSSRPTSPARWTSPSRS